MKIIFNFDRFTNCDQIAQFLQFQLSFHFNFQSQRFQFSLIGKWNVKIKIYFGFNFGDAIHSKVSIYYLILKNFFLTSSNFQTFNLLILHNDFST